MFNSISKFAVLSLLTLLIATPAALSYSKDDDQRYDRRDEQRFDNRAARESYDRSGDRGIVPPYIREKVDAAR